MKLTTSILVLGMGLGTAWAQNPDVIQDTRSTLQNTQKKQTIDQNAVLSASGQGQSSTSAPATATTNMQGKTAVTVAPSNPPKAAAGEGRTKAATIGVRAPAEPEPTVAVDGTKRPAETKK